MNSRELKRTLLKVFVGFLSLTAGIAIVSVLMGEFGEFQMKVLATTLTISVASICSMSCAAFIEKRRQLVLGGIGIGCSVLAASLVIGGVWGEVSGQDYWRTSMSLNVVAVAFAHVFLLSLPSLVRAHHWVYWVGPSCIGLLVVECLLALWQIADSDLFFRGMTVTSILVVLITLIVPILVRIGGAKEKDGSDTAIRLTRRHDNVFVDSEGALYRVIPQSEWVREDDKESEVTHSS